MMELVRLIVAGAVLSAPTRETYRARWTPTLASATGIPIHVPRLRAALDEAESQGWIVGADCRGTTTWGLTDGGRARVVAGADQTRPEGR